MMTQIKKRAKDFVAIIVLFILAIAVSGYILSQQRLRFPFIQSTPKTLKAEFQTAQAVEPGQGQTVRISGVKIGDISDVKLKNGVAIVYMDVLPQYLKRIHTDATALLRPKTGLKDMFIELQPGSKKAPKAKNGWTIPMANTQPDVNLDEFLSVLDGDTRAYLQLLVNGAGKGLNHNGGRLAEVFRRFEPTHRDLARFSKAVAARRANVRRLVTSLAELNEALGTRRKDLTQLVDASAATFHAFANENQNISKAVRLLPGTLRQTTETLGKVQRFSNILGPASRNLIPAVKLIPAANRALTSLARTRTDEVRDDIRPFVREVRPLVRQLRPAATNLAKATPDLTTSFKVLNHLFNTLAYNQKGREGPEVRNRQEGYLFWLAWLNHNALTLFSSQDANGGYRPLFLTIGCSSAKQLVTEQLGAEALLNLTPALNNPALCGNETP